MQVPAGSPATPEPLRRRGFPYAWYLAAVAVVALAALCIAKVEGWGVFHRPTVRVAYNHFPPYVDKGPNGVPVGFAAEIFAQAAGQAGVDIRWVEIPGAAEPAFDAGTADMYPLMAITAEREARYHMSAPWWENQFALFSTEGRAIRDVAGLKGKVIASRSGFIQGMARKMFPEARMVTMDSLPQIEEALCERKIDGFVSDVRLLQMQLLNRSRGCAGQQLHITYLPKGILRLGTCSTKATASANDRIFREIAKLAIDGTMAHAAAKAGLFIPYDSTELKQVVDAQSRATRMTWILAVTLLVLTLSVRQTVLLRRAKRRVELAQNEAKQMHDWFDEFMRHTPTITFIKDLEGRVVYSNEAFSTRQEPFGVIASDGGISERLKDRDEEVLKLGRGVEVMETLHFPNGENRHFLVLKFPFQGVAGTSFLGGVALDVTPRILAEKELELYARSDLLTGLPNRRSFMQELTRAIDGRNRLHQQLAVGFMDLDGFKPVNDRFGHEAGDELLKAVAGRLRLTCRDSDMVARLGGDEFTFFLPGISGPEALQVMVRVLRAIEAPFRVEGEDMCLSASIGLSLFPDHGSSPQQLLRNADAAMYYAKRTGKGKIEFWSRDLDDPIPTEEPKSDLDVLAGHPAL